MTGHYEIVIGLGIYDVNLIDNKAKITWEKGESGLVFKKKLDGSFIMNRATNETCYDAIKAMTHCDTAALRITQPDNTTFTVVSVFNKRDISYNDDKCQVTIKPRYYDPNNIDAVITKDLNIINDAFDVYTVQYETLSMFEYITYTKANVFCNDLVWDINTLQWYSTTHSWIPVLKIFNNAEISNQVNNSNWTYFSQTNTKVDQTTDDPIFNISTTWFREIRYVPKAIDPLHDKVFPDDASFYDFAYLQTVTINGQLYNKYTRYVDSLVATDLMDEPLLNNHSLIDFSLTSYFGSTSTRTLTRARRLIDILYYFKTEFGCTTLSSHFFKDAINPISGVDLRYLMIMQKSDAIYVDGSETSDPATKGIITFQQLMEQLWAMFQVTWLVQDDILYIEHIKYFRNNFSYLTNTTVGIDLTTVYPTALVGTHAYDYEKSIPLREKFSFMESWNVDFVGTDINYTNCLEDGETVDYSASLITTDIDPLYLDSQASRDGFVLLHCNDGYFVITTIGKLTTMSISNGHLSWANLHDAYWRSNRYLDTGMMNNVAVTFPDTLRKLKKQMPIRFPYCVEDFELYINDLVRTTMGDGEIETAEYAIKDGYIQIELAYL